MKILNGWKEIAECLHRTPRSARRWERLGLPVRRISDSRRSQIIAFSDELEDWARKRKKKTRRVSGFDTVLANFIAFKSTQHETQRLVNELTEAGIEHRRLLRTIRNQIDKTEGISL